MLKFPFEISSIDSALNAELLQYFKGERSGFVQVGPKKYFFPSKYKNEAEKYYNFQARADDIWVVTCPRSGTTLTQELVWLVANDMDFKTARKRPLTERFPFFEFPIFVHPDIKEELLRENAEDVEKLDFIKKLDTPGYKTLDNWDTRSRRFIKTHFPFSLLPPSILDKQCKIIYVSRNPKDVAVSYYHLNRLYRTQGYVGNFERYWNYFARGLNPWLPYHSHINEAKAHRHLPNVLFLNYEDILANLEEIIMRISNFLDCSLSINGLMELVNHLNIDNFRKNCAVNGHEMAEVGLLFEGEAEFIRNGGKGKQEELLQNAKLEEAINRWIKENGI